MGVFKEGFGKEQARQKVRHGKLQCADANEKIVYRRVSTAPSGICESVCENAFRRRVRILSSKDEKCEIASLSSRSNSLKFAILQETSGFQIGEIKLCYQDKEDEPCISVLIYDEFKRQGYASEAVGALYEKLRPGAL